MKRLLSFATALIFFISCSRTADKKPETGITIADTLLNKIETDPTYTPIRDSSKLMVVKNDGEAQTYTAFKHEFTAESSFTAPSFEQQDIDKDGNNELIVKYYTGGAHCCDVTIILARTGDNEMGAVLDFMGGTSISGDTVRLDFFEALGYFHTCYACAVDYPKDAGPVATLRYKNGKFSFLPTDPRLNVAIEANLKSITGKGIPDKDTDEESGFDDGTRKAVAFNVVAYYFNNDRNITATQSLFDKYYFHKDKAGIWKDIAHTIQSFDLTLKKAVSL